MTENSSPRARSKCLDSMAATELEYEPELCTVIVDSGADVSRLPRDYVHCGHAVKSSPITVQDAQGGLMQVSDERLIEFVIPSESHGDVVIRERCIIADVTQPLLSMGRLIKKGWFPCRGDRGLWLNHDPSGADVKMRFKGMSLTVQAIIRRVEQPNGVASASPSSAASASSRSIADSSTASSRSVADPSTASSRSVADPSTASSRSVPVNATPVRTVAEPSDNATTVHHAVRVIGRAELNAECDSYASVGKFSPLVILRGGVGQAGRWIQR